MIAATVASTTMPADSRVGFKVALNVVRTERGARRVERWLPDIDYGPPL